MFSDGSFTKCLCREDGGDECDVYLLVRKKYRNELNNQKEGLYVCDRYCDHYGGELIITKNQLVHYSEFDKYSEVPIGVLSDIVLEYFL
jgi:hypothetical protein